MTIDVVIDRSKENPRWTLCRAALAREPRAWEFGIWIRTRWREFADHLEAPKLDTFSGQDRERAALLIGYDKVDNDFDAWLEAGVRAGQWRGDP